MASVGTWAVGRIGCLLYGQLCVFAPLLHGGWDVGKGTYSQLYIYIVKLFIYFLPEGGSLRPLDGASLGAATMGMRSSMELALQAGHGKCGHTGGGKDWVLGY